MVCLPPPTEDSKIAISALVAFPSLSLFLHERIADTSLPSALRRPRPSPARLLPAPRLGHPRTRHPHPSRVGCCGQLFGPGHDTE